jgi:hypothetical protein
MSAAGGPQAAVRLIVGWFSVLIGILNLLAEADRRTGGSDVPFLLFHCMLVAGGIMLLGLSRLAADPGLPGYATGGAVATIGLVVSTLPVTNSVCCMAGSGERHGFPFTLLGRDAPAASRWQIDVEHLVADLLFWGYAGLLVLVLIALFRRITSRHGDAPVRNRHAEPVAHAEQARTGQPSPADGTVGGLP